MKHHPRSFLRRLGTGMLQLLLLAGLPSALGAAPGGRPSIPAKDVTLYFSGEAPSRPFEVLGPLCTTKSTGSYPKALREAAGKLGAEAVIGVHDFRAPRTLGVHLQSGMAVHWLPENTPKIAPAANAAVAFVALLEAPIENTNTFAEITDSMLLIGGLQLRSMGYCPIYVNAPLPLSTNVPSVITFDLLKDSEASLCDKLVVLRVTKRTQVFGGVGGKAAMEIVGQLISRADNKLLWSHTNQLTRVGLGPLGGINVASTGFMGHAGAQTLRSMPKYR